MDHRSLILLMAACCTMISCVSNAEGNTQLRSASASVNAVVSEDKTVYESQYEPMAVFAKFAGKTMRGEWIGDDGNKVVDISTSKMILGGKAYQGTHKIEGSTYGGRTIIFYDEGAKEYIFHYFTTAGFHTIGKLEVNDEGYTGTETINGHPTIAEVSSTLKFDGDRQHVLVKYKNHDGEWSDAPPRVYEPYNGPKPFFEGSSE